MQSLTDSMTQLAGAEAVVVGDLLLDQWLRGSAERLCREGPVPVVTVDDETFAPGGAANVAVNVASLGGHARLVGVVGEDDDSRRLLALLRDAGVDVTDVVAVPDRPVVVKRRLVTDGQVLARFDTGRPTPVPAVVERRLSRRLGRLPARTPVLVADYGLAGLGPGMRQAIGRRAAGGGVVVVDGHSPADWAGSAPTAVTPDWEEVRPLLPDVPYPDRPHAVAANADLLLDRCGSDLVVVTLDRDGAVLLERGRPAFRAYAEHVPHPQGTGAGDAFTAAFTLALASGSEPAGAVELATIAASQVVRRPGTTTCDRASLLRRLEGADRDVVDVTEAGRLAGSYRRAGQRVVLTNGCFDVLHRGHVAYLNEAKRQGDVLVVGLNDDPSVRRLKGPNRPLNTVGDRAAVLAALSCVDHIVVFGGENAAELVRAVRPDVYVKGGDYKDPDDLAEAPDAREVGAEVRILTFVPEHSTTGLVERIRAGGGETSA